MLVAFVGLIVARKWKSWKDLIAFSKLEWVAIIVFFGAIFVRLNSHFPFHILPRLIRCTHTHHPIDSFEWPIAPKFVTI